MTGNKHQKVSEVEVVGIFDQMDRIHSYGVIERRFSNEHPRYQVRDLKSNEVLFLRRIDFRKRDPRMKLKNVPN